MTAVDVRTHRTTPGFACRRHRQSATRRGAAPTAAGAEVGSTARLGWHGQVPLLGALFA